MKLNEKYEKFLDTFEELIDSAGVTAELQTVIGVGLILRQVVEIQQKLDELKEEMKK